MRKLNDINAFIGSQIEYYESNEDYAGNYLDMVGDRLQYDGVYSEDEIDSIMDSNLTTDTDYSYLNDDAVCVFPIGEIEVTIETNLTQREYEAIEDNISHPSRFNDGEITAYVCAGMNVRIYSDFK